jgi:hypothetical protein
MAKRKNKSRRKAKVKITRRNPIAVAAFLRSGSGRHPDQKKVADKRACRGSVKW